jgi:hypothetical protein
MIWKRKEKPKGKAITVQQGVAANALPIQAIINVLVDKKVCTREEMLEELKRISGQDRAHVKVAD